MTIRFLILVYSIVMLTKVLFMQNMSILPGIRFGTLVGTTLIVKNLCMICLERK